MEVSTVEFGEGNSYAKREGSSPLQGKLFPQTDETVETYRLAEDASLSLVLEEWPLEARR